MKATASLVLVLGLIGSATLARAQDKKADPPKLEGKYNLVGGKIMGNPVDEASKKATYTITADRITIEGMGLKFVIGYKLDAKAAPVAIDLEILEGPDGAKGTKAAGIVEVKGETLKLAYSLEKDKRPKDFEGKDGHLFELKKTK